MSMKTSSAKAKGRKLQQQVAKLINNFLGIETKSLPMGSQGADIIVLGEAKKIFPYSVECKNQEKIQLWKAWEQSKANTTEGTKPLLIIKRNRSDTLAILSIEDLLTILKKNNETIVQKM